MGEYEPDDSRDVTLTDGHAPGEPPRTGPREGEARARAKEKDAEQEKDRPRSERNESGLNRPEHQAQPRVRRGTMMEPPQQKGIQIQPSGSQSQSQGQSQRSAPEQPADTLDGDGARQADEDVVSASEDSEAHPAQPGENETDTASDRRPANALAPEPGSREAGVAQSGKEDLIEEGDSNRNGLHREDRGQRPAQYETNTPQNMPPAEDDRRKREQARMQERQEPERDQRGYGRLGEAREEAEEENR